MRTLSIYTTFDGKLVVSNSDSSKRYDNVTPSSRQRLETITYYPKKVFCRALISGTAPTVFISSK